MRNQFIAESVLSVVESELSEENQSPPQFNIYLYDMNGLPLARYNAGRTHAFLKNAHNDVVADLNGDGTLVEPINYSAFGQSDLGASENTSGYPFAFQGQYRDSQTKLSHLNARLYNPDTAQFLSPDSFPGKTEVPYSLNKYAYSHNDPVNYWDQSGLYDSEVHYYKTKDWAYSMAMNMGFEYEFSRKLAFNIASFDQYHDKEWTLAPNNYTDFEDGMVAGGQGNTLHFMNPNRDQMTFGTLQINTTAQITAPGEIPDFTVEGWSEFIDPKTNVIRVQETEIQVYKMKSMRRFDSRDGANHLVNDPTQLRNGRKITKLTLGSGNITERLGYAIDSHDPRLFGIALHEYQDTFAHAGFGLWHGTSSANDQLCDAGKSCPFTTFKEKAEAVLTGVYGGTQFMAKKYGRRAIETRDYIMEAGTKYWLEKFLTEQARHYEEEYRKSTTYNKEENLLSTADINGLRLDQEFGNYDNLGNVYLKQGLKSSGFFEKMKRDPNQIFSDFINQINTY